MFSIISIAFQWKPAPSHADVETQKEENWSKPREKHQANFTSLEGVSVNFPEQKSTRSFVTVILVPYAIWN